MQGPIENVNNWLVHPYIEIVNNIKGQREYVNNLKGQREYHFVYNIILNNIIVQFFT